MRTVEYYIKEVRSVFEVAKFDGTKAPTEVYTVDVKRGKCNCIGALAHGKHGSNEKHVKMVNLWLAVGCPDPWTWNRIRKIQEEHGMD